MPVGSRRRSRLRGKLRLIALALSLGSIFVGFALAPRDAAGEKSGAPRPAAKPKTAPDAGSRYDPDDVTAISEFMETVGKGNEKYAAKDYPAAIDIFKKAIQLNSRNALGPYLLGEAHLATGNLSEAEAAFKAAEEVDDAKHPLVRSHVLFALADCYEREKKRDLAKTAWQAYVEHAAKLGPDGGAHPQSGAARIKAIEDWLKLDAQYEIVRRRIAAEKTDSGAPDAAKAPAK